MANTEESFFSNTLTNGKNITLTPFLPEREPQTALLSEGDFSAHPWARSLAEEMLRELWKETSFESVEVIQSVEIQDPKVTYRLCMVTLKNLYRSVYYRVVREAGDRVISVPFHFFGQASFLSLRGDFLVVGGMGTLVLRADTLAVVKSMPDYSSALSLDGGLVVERQGVFYALSSPLEEPEDSRVLANYPGSLFVGADEEGYFYLVLHGEIVVLERQGASLALVFRSKVKGQVCPALGKSLGMKRLVYFQERNPNNHPMFYQLNLEKDMAASSSPVLNLS